MSNFERGTVFLGAACLLATLAPAAGAAVVAPYSNHFNDSASDFSLSTAGGGWTLDTSGTGVLGHSNTNGSGGTLFTASVEVGNLGGAADLAIDFEVSGVYSASALVGSFDYLGLAALGDGPELLSDSNSLYLLRHRRSGDFELYRVTGGNSTKVAGIASEVIALNTPYTITLAGTYVDTDSDGTNDALNLVGELTRGTESWSINYQDTVPFTGTYFGMRDQNANNNATATMTWDVFSISAVPEPAGAAGLVLLGAAMRRRRSR